MAKYLISHRRAGRKADPGKPKDKMEETLNSLRNIQRTYDSGTGKRDHARRVVMFECEPGEVVHASRDDSDVIIEPQITHRPHLLWRRFETATDGAGEYWCVRATHGSKPLEGAEAVFLYQNQLAKGRAKTPPQLSKPQRTSSDGWATIYLNSGEEPVVLRMAPAGGFWSTFQSKYLDKHSSIDCPPLPRNGPLAWWHRAVGSKENLLDRGRHISVGVLGTGVGPHPCLDHVELVDKKKDCSDHETFVSGLIGARPKDRHQFAGIAPGAKIYSMQIFESGPDGELTTDQGKIAHAIDFLSDPEYPHSPQVDVINMSFGDPQPSKILHDAIKVAYENGTLCVGSIGNNGFTGGTQEYPAAFPEVIGVSALGLEGWGPRNAFLRFLMPDKKTQPDRFGKDRFYVPKFTSFGPSVSCIAPGSGVISAFPERWGLKAPFADGSGTSAACAVVSGVLAALLSDSPEYRNLPRNESRARKAAQLLRKTCRDIGVQRKFQGPGLPSLE